MSNEAKMHEMLAKFKDLAIELGKTPTVLEGDRAGLCGPTVRRYFGSHAQLVQAAGLEPNRVGGKVKIDNSIFNRNIHEHIAQYEPQDITKVTCPSFAVISDIHFPWPNKRVLEAFYNYVKLHKPEFVLLNGDSWDMYSHTKFPRSHNQFTPKEERDLSRKMNEDFWADVKKASPKSRCVQLLGNHDIRPMKRILEAYPAGEHWIEEMMKKEFTFDGVETIFDVRQELYLNDEVILFHGHMSGIGGHRDQTMMCTVNGHTHRGGVVYRAVKGKIIWELNSGLAGDPYAKGLTYTPQKIVEWTPGFGAHDEHGPRFIPS